MPGLEQDVQLVGVLLQIAHLLSRPLDLVKVIRRSMRRRMVVAL